MKNSISLALMLTVALPAVSQAAPAQYAAVKKPAPHIAGAAKTAPLPATVPSIGSRPFSDVPPNHWAASAVETLRRRGIVVGYPAAGKK